MRRKLLAGLCLTAAAGGCVGWDEPPPPITRDQLNESVVLAATAPGLERGEILTHGAGGPGQGREIVSTRNDQLVAGADPLEVLVALLADARAPTVAWDSIYCHAADGSVSGVELVDRAVVSSRAYLASSEREVRVRVSVGNDSTVSDTLPRKEPFVSNECDRSTLDVLGPVTGIELP